MDFLKYIFRFYMVCDAIHATQLVHVRKMEYRSKYIESKQRRVNIGNENKFLLYFFLERVHHCRW